MKKRSCFILFFVLLLCLQGCIQIHPDGPGQSSENNGDGTQTPPVSYYPNTTYSYLTEVDEDALLTGKDIAYLVLANKTFPVGNDYEPTNLVTLTCNTTYPMKLEACAAAALYEMLDEMKVAGAGSGLYVTSAYRSYQYQSALYDKYLKDEMSTISTNAYAYLGYDYIQSNYLSKGATRLSRGDAERVVLSYSAYPGTSEHQTGLCVDFITDSMGGELTTAFETTDAFAWLSQNAYKFGFILRYPKGKETITGYTYEPWHYRFVGREVATDIYFGNLTLEQYLGV
jgi:LAS superfamily LD-carboxypeptidase LdcB